MKIQRPPRGTEYSTLADVYNIAYLAWRSRWVRLGQEGIWRQARGVPIGGMYSDCAAALLLAADEEAWEEFGWPTYARTTIPRLAHLPWREVTMAIRYVDDTLLGSSLVCHTCLDELFSHIYKSAAFVKCQSGTVVNWTHFTLTTSAETGLHIWDKASGPKQVVIDHLMQKAPYRIPPCLADGSQVLRMSGLQSLFRQRCLQWKQSSLATEPIRKAVAAELTGWIIRGHPPRTMRTVASTSCPTCRSFVSEFVQRIEHDDPENWLQQLLR